MFSPFWLMLLSYSSLVSASQPTSIFILAGQSNMSGRGGVVNDTWDGVVPPQCRSSPRILQLSGARTWEEAREPLHRDVDVEKTCGVGPGMAFAHSVLRRDAAGLGVIGLVPCAIGGTNISEWRRGGRLYNQMLDRARVASQGGGGLIRAILWYQGESDTVNHEDARMYKRRLEKFFTDVRADLLSPVLPVIQVTLGIGGRDPAPNVKYASQRYLAGVLYIGAALASGSGPYVDIIRKAQKEIELPNVRCVDAYGLQLQPDALHLSTAAQVRLGPMLAESFFRIMAPLPVQSSAAAKRFNNFFLDFFLRWFR